MSKTLSGRAALAHALLDPLGVNPNDVTDLVLHMAQDGSTTLTATLAPTQQDLDDAAGAVKRLALDLFTSARLRSEEDQA